MRFYKYLFTLVIAAAGVAQGLAQYDVLPTTGRNELFHDYLIEELDSMMAKRADAVAAAVTSPENVKARQAEMRQKYLSILGELPDREALNAEVVGTVTTENGYHIEKLHYQSLPNHHVTANFYIPDTGTAPYPTVIFTCGHYPVAKVYEDYQNLSILFAKHGIACLIVDPICQYERYQIMSSTGTLSFTGQSGTSAQSQLDQGLVNAGSSSVAQQVFDNSRGIDYLYTRTDVVDTSRVGCVGHSGGGAQATYLLAFDKRLKVGTVANFLANETAMYTITGPQTAGQNLSYEGEVGIDEPDYVEMFAPKPYLIIGSNDGLFPLAATQQTYEEAKLFYDQLGASDAISLLATESTVHDYFQLKREETVRWFKRWFYDMNDTIIESGQTTQSYDNLYVTGTKNVMTAFDNEKNVTMLNQEMVDGYAADREAFWTGQTQAEAIEQVKEIIRYKAMDEAPVYEATETIDDRETYTIEKGKITYKHHVPVTTLTFIPKNNTEKLPGVLYVDGRGKKQDAGDWGLIHQVYIDSGYVVMSIDVRGFGETSDNSGKNETKHNNKEHRNAVISLYEGKTLPGQRVQDIEKAMEIFCSRSDVDASNITLVGVDRASVAALHAAAIDSRFTKTVIRLASETPWLDVVATPTIKDQMTHEIPNVLQYYDITSLIENGIAPREVVFAGEPELKDPPDAVETYKLDKSLYQNFPNPFSDRSWISYSLEATSDVSIDIYGTDGRLVRTIRQSAQGPGSYKIELNAKDFTPGVYIYNMNINNMQAESHKMIVSQP